MSNKSEKQNIIKCHKIEEQLEQDLGRPALPEEIATEMQMPLEKVIKWQELIIEDENYENPNHELKFKLTIKNNELEKIRLKMGLTQEQVAEKIGRSNSFYSHIESCRIYPDYYWQCEIAKIFNESIYKLFPKWLQAFTNDWKKRDNTRIVPKKQLSISSGNLLLLENGDYEKMIDSTNASYVVNKFMQKLTPKEQQFLNHRYGLIDKEPKTLEEVAQIYGVTRERIRQIEGKLFDKIRHPIT
jgi:RNA polymerase sigma factor (sigma-70 family)